MRILTLIVLMLATQQPPELRTRAEITDYAETSTHADVMRIAKGIAAASPLAHYESYGRTEEEREMPLLVLSNPPVSTPEAARKLGRPIVYIQGNIHAGEVEGKEAALILARRLTQGDLRPMLAQLVVLIAPIYNGDGNEKVSLQNRSAQYGPIAGVGTRENTNGLDLNRDHMKLDSAEARAFVGLLNRWDPHVGIDLHTTNGSYHGYHLTYSPSLNPNADPRLLALARERILPAVAGAVLEKQKFRTYYYGNFASESGKPVPPRVDPANPGDTVWRTFDHRPRFNNNYLGLRNRLALLSEAYSYVDFRDRVRVTEVFVEEALNAVVANAKQILTLTAQLDAETKAYAGATAKLPALGVDFRIAALPSPVEILVGDVEKKVNPRSQREMLVMADRFVPVTMKDYGVFEATRTVTMPQGWLIPRAHVDSGAYATALERLRVHGVQVQRVVANAELMVERFVIDAYTRAPKPFQNRNEARLTGRHEAAKLSAQEGALFIPANQPLARLAFYLLEPESDDGFVTWNLIEAGLSPGATYPIYRVTGGVMKALPSPAPSDQRTNAEAAALFVPSTPGNVTWGDYPADKPAVLRVQSGQTVRIDTLSQAGTTQDEHPVDYLARFGVKREEVLKDVLDFWETKSTRPRPGRGPHIMTGPIFVEGAAPGDTLEVQILDVTTRVPYGLNNSGPTSGVLDPNYAGRVGPFYSGKLDADYPGRLSTTPPVIPPHGPVGNRTLIRTATVGGREVALFSADITVPLAPFMGVMAVAPAEPVIGAPGVTVAGVQSSTPPGVFGGNMDVKDLKAGSTLFLPVFHPGALFYTGDPHSAQGDGEVSGTAIEHSLTGTFRFVLHKGKTIRTPRAEDATHYILMGIDLDLDRAMRLATQEVVLFLVEEKGLTLDEAYSLASIAVDFHVAEAVDQTQIITGKIPKSIFR